MSDVARPASAYVHGDGSIVIVPARIAARLDTLANLRRLRISVRGQDPELDAVLIALGVAAAAWRTTATGSPRAPAPETGPDCEWLSTNQAAALLGVTDRRVRQMITGGHLTAHRIGGRWRINREDLEHYQAARRAA